MYNMYVNTLLVKKHTIISTDAENPFDKKLQHPFKKTGK